MASKLYLNVNVPGLYMYKTGNVTPPPWITPQGYLTVRARSFRNGIPQMSGSSEALSAIRGSSSTGVSAAYAKAFDKLIGKVSSGFSVNLGETLGEGRQALNMVAERVSQLTRAYSSLRRGDIRSMLREFGYRPKRRNHTWVRVGRGGKKQSFSNERVKASEADIKRRVKTPAKLWLEYKLGWEPIISELYNSLEQAIEVHPLTFKHRFSVTGTTTSRSQKSPVRSWYKGGTVTEPELWDLMYSVRLKATVRVKEPLKKKFADNGIVNPALIAWNLTPGSMFVDWFLPVSKYLNGFTAFYGIEIRDVVRTDKRSSIHQFGTYFSEFPQNNVESKNEASLFQRSYTSGVVSLRVPGLLDRTGTGVKSATRAATAVSVLITMLNN